MKPSNEEPRNIYEETFGRKPSGNAKEETILARLAKEGITFDDEKKAEEVKEKEEPKKPVKSDVKVDAQSGLPIIEGRGNHALHLVYFRGQARQWTAASIQAMRSHAKEIQFPEGTQYEEANNFSTCKTCG